MVVAAPAKVAPRVTTGFVIISKSNGQALCRPQATAQEAWDTFWCSGWWRSNRVIVEGQPVRLDWSAREQHFTLAKVTA